MVIITGLGRCGTSVLIRYLKRVGIGVGYNINWHEEANAGFELSTFYSLIHDLYHLFCKEGKPINLDTKCLGHYWDGRTYREALIEVDKDERQGNVEVVKDPRITWHPDLIEAIYEARQDIKLIICHRKIEDIMASRESLPIRYGDPKPRKELWEYKADFADFYTRVLKLEIEHIFMYFPDFLKDYNKAYNKIVHIGLPHSFLKGLEVWGNLIDKSRWA